MNHCDDCIEQETVSTLRSIWELRTAARPRDRYNLPKPRWREMVKALLAPALRLHRYRNMRSAMFYEAMAEVDCPVAKQCEARTRTADGSTSTRPLH